MSQKTKLYITILAVAAVILGSIVFITGVMAPVKADSIEFPASTLSDSIFDSQNTTYTENESFPNTHTCNYIPYSIDTIDVDGAVIDTGTIYQVNSTRYLMYSEIAKGDDICDALAYQFANVLDFQVSKSNVSYESLVTDDGYVDGFAAEYDVIKVNVISSTGESLSGYVIADILEISDDDEFEEKYDLAVCACTTVGTTDELASMKAVLDANVFTVQYDSSLASELIDAQKKLESEQEAASEDTEETEIETEEVASEVEEVDSEETAVAETTDEVSSVTDTSTSDVVEEETTSQGLMINKTYSNLTIYVEWSNTSVSPTITITNPSGSKTYSANKVENGKATFNIGAAESGVYLIEMTKGDQLGTLNLSLEGK